MEEDKDEYIPPVKAQDAAEYSSAAAKQSLNAANKAMLESIRMAKEAEAAAALVATSDEIVTNEPIEGDDDVDGTEYYCVKNVGGESLSAAPPPPPAAAATTPLTYDDNEQVPMRDFSRASGSERAEATSRLSRYRAARRRRARRIRRATRVAATMIFILLAAWYWSSTYRRPANQDGAGGDVNTSERKNVEVELDIRVDENNSKGEKNDDDNEEYDDDDEDEEYEEEEYEDEYEDEGVSDVGHDIDKEENGLNDEGDDEYEDYYEEEEEEEEASYQKVRHEEEL